VAFECDRSLRHLGIVENRGYVEADLGWIHFLKLLRAMGMPIQQMQQFMELARDGDDTLTSSSWAFYERIENW